MKNSAANSAPTGAEKVYTKAEFDAALSTELEGANKRISELESAQRLRVAKDSAIEALSKAGAKSTELIWRALQGDLEFDDSGNVKNLDALVSDFKVNYPDHFGIQKPIESINAGAGGPSVQMKPTLEQIKTMSPDEINKRWDEVKDVLSSK